MKKIVLDVDALAVDSFEAEPKVAGARGTVQGHATLRCTPATYYCTLGHDTCYEASCVGTCGYPYKPAC